MTTTLSKHGQRLGGALTSEQEGRSELGRSGKEAAARAAELRYNQNKENLTLSQQKLKAMQLTSKRDKGLA